MHARAAAFGLILGMTPVSACSADCFVPGTEPPRAERVLPALNNGQAGRELMSAVFNGDVDAAAHMLRADPQLRTTGDGRFADLLNVAVGRCDRKMTALLLAHGAPPDGPRGEVPLVLALRAHDLWFAERLLEAGARPDGGPQRNGSPATEAMSLNDWDRVELLLKHGLDLNARDETGETLLHEAVGMDNFRLAERLLDRGADPWAVGFHGGAVGTGAARPLAFEDSREDEARSRIVDRLKAAGWPWPPPDARQVRAAVLAGAWPPPGAKGAGATPDWVAAKMRELYDADGNRKAKRPSSP